MWQNIIERNCPTSMAKMVKYCKGDVLLLEKVYDKLNPYTYAKTHVGVILGEGKCSCPNCGSDEHQSRGTMTTTAGSVKKRFQCQKCYKWFSVALTTWNKYNKLNMAKV